MIHKDPRRTGSAISFGVVLALVLVILGVAFLMLSMYLNGSNELKNSVDSGALNVGKQALDNVTVKLDPSNFFYDVTNDGDPTKNDGNINLRRINRVWAKALLVALNSDSAQRDVYAKNDGNDPSNMDNGAQQAFSDAQDISNQLTEQLTQNPNSQFEDWFRTYASSNSIRMLGRTNTVDVKEGSGWTTSCMDRGAEGNITVNQAIFPPLWNSTAAGAYALPNDTQIATTRNPAPSGSTLPDGSQLQFLRGYTPIEINNRQFWQVPFQYDEKPHLVSLSLFNQGIPMSSPISGWDAPIPNSFSCVGKSTSNKSLNETATAWVLSNPRQTFQMAMPHSFVHIRLDQMQAHYYFFPGIPNVPSGKGQDPNNPPQKKDIPAAEQAIEDIDDALQFADGLAWEFGDPTTYGYDLDTEGSGFMPFGGILAASVECDGVQLGLDVVGRPLDGIIFDAPPLSIPSELNDKLPSAFQFSATDISPGTGLIEAYLVSRANQMASRNGVSFTAKDVHTALQDPFTIQELMNGDSDGQDFYMYSPDGKSLRVRNHDDAAGDSDVPWLSAMIDNAPDGGSNDAKIVDDDMCPAPDVFFPIVEPDPYCAPVFMLGWETWDKDLYWRPGSGYNGCLGTVRVKRWTDVYSLGICVF